MYLLYCIVLGFTDIPLFGLFGSGFLLLKSLGISRPSGEPTATLATLTFSSASLKQQLITTSEYSSDCVLVRFVLTGGACFLPTEVFLLTKMMTKVNAASALES